MRGCDNYCSYCIVPYVRGREHSLKASVIKARVQELVDQGTREVTLLGQNVNSYRDPDSGADFPELLKAIHDVSGLLRIRFTTSHPKDCSATLIRTLAELPKVCKHLHLPVQSGSTRILGLMERGYSRDNFKRLIDDIRISVPGIDITTDIMTGFPTESEADFQETLSLVREVRFTAAFMFHFSPRPQTKAAAMDGVIDPSTAKARLRELIDLQTGITKEHYQSMVGKTIDVLFTEKQEKSERGWMGQDNGCKRVLFACSDDLAGTILPMKIKVTTGMTLVAERSA
jgi:tRNA-2-methylthio-N6-dimethylallyladenosine synthase